MLRSLYGMKKFEVTQELMLLRDAILSAEIQGFDFESEGECHIYVLDGRRPPPHGGYW